MIRFHGPPSRIMTQDETLTLRRFNNNLDDPAGIQIVDGKRVLGGYEEFQIACNVQPATGDDLVQTPEGVRYNDQMLLWVWETSEQPLPNDFVYRDVWYLVMAATYWGSFTAVRMQAVDIGPYRALGF